MRPYLIHHLLEQAAVTHPEKIAIKQAERTVTYGELIRESQKMKCFLQEQGVKKGDRVGIFLDKSIEQLTAMFGISMAGAVFVFINTILKKNQIEYIIHDCTIKLLITTAAHHKKAGLSVPETVLYMSQAAPEDDSALCWQSIREQMHVDEKTVRQISEDTGCLIYTSGSSGMPKGVVVPHRTVVDGAEIVSSYLSVSENDILISVLPFNFDYGLNQATSSVLHRATLVMHNFFLVKDLLTVLEKEHITGFAGMTPIWSKMFSGKFDPKAEQSFPRLRYITNTGGKVHRSILEKMRSFFPTTRIFLMYGLTEAFRSTFLPPDQLDKRPDSMGKAIPNAEILVVNSEGKECAPGEPGELVHRGALVTKGYWNDPEKTTRVFRNNPLFGDQGHLNETVVFSGDLVKKDEEGFLYFISRRDEMIKTSGFRVSPTEVEAVLIEIPDISNAVVFGKESETADQIIAAVIETPLSADEKGRMLQECKKRFPGYMVPRQLFFEKEFPKTANGKIDRSLIKKKWLGAKEEHGA